MTADLVKQWLHSGWLALPLPGSGLTAVRWHRLSELAERDVVAGRLAEAHLDAAAILCELGGSPPATGELWGVWAAEGPHTAVVATATGDGTFRLDGVKQWCSGAGLCSHALITAALGDSADGGRGLFTVAIDGVAAAPLPSAWSNPGMAGSDTRAVQFSDAHAIAVGGPGDYLNRPGFWHGAIGVAACWFGGARAVAEPLYRRVARGSADAHTLAHLGAVDAGLAAAAAVLDDAATQIDRAPRDTGSAELLARRVRAVVERAADEAITRTGRALGAGPLCQDSVHARHVADLSVYLRQSHAEKDLEALGRLAGRGGSLRAKC